MKKKEIVTLIIALIVIAGSVFFMLQILFPSSGKVATQGKKTQVVPVPQEIDETLYKNVSDLEDYGKPTLDGVGKKDLFSGF